jgi:hypothetical protein
MSDLARLVNDPSAKWERASPAEESCVASLSGAFGKPLPQDFLTFLKLSNGGEGELGVWPGWFIIWAAETVPERNKAYEVADRYPGFVAFGSNGGGEMLAFDLRCAGTCPIVALPFIGLDVEEAMPVAPDFSAFVKQLGRESSA